MTNVIYIGRSVGAVMENQLFVRFPKRIVASLKNDYPLIDALFVPVTNLDSALDELKDPATKRYKAYKQVGGEGRRNGNV